MFIDDIGKSIKGDVRSSQYFMCDFKEIRVVETLPLAVVGSPQ